MEERAWEVLNTDSGEPSGRGRLAEGQLGHIHNSSSSRNEDGMRRGKTYKSEEAEKWPQRKAPGMYVRLCFYIIPNSRQN